MAYDSKCKAVRNIYRNFKFGGYRKKLGGVNLRDAQINTTLTLENRKNYTESGDIVFQLCGGVYPPPSYGGRGGVKIGKPLATTFRLIYKSRRSKYVSNSLTSKEVADILERIL